MRRLLIVRLAVVTLSASLVALLPAPTATAAEDTWLARIPCVHVTFANGSDVGFCLRFGFGEEVSDSTITGHLLDDSGNVVQYLDYDFHNATIFPEDLPFRGSGFFIQYRQDGFEKARLRFVDETACLNDPDCDHTVEIKARWDGYGPLMPDPYNASGGPCDPINRAATLKGNVLVDGEPILGSDLSLVPGILQHWPCGWQ